MGHHRHRPEPGRCRQRARFECVASGGSFDSEVASDLFEDREGSLWAVHDNGIAQHLPDERFAQFTTIAGAAQQRSSIPS